MADAHVAMGLFYYYCLQDFDRALTELEIAHGRAPNDANILLMIALVKRRQGKLDESIEGLAAVGEARSVKRGHLGKPRPELSRRPPIRRSSLHVRSRANHSAQQRRHH